MINTEKCLQVDIIRGQIHGVFMTFTFKKLNTTEQLAEHTGKMPPTGHCTYMYIITIHRKVHSIPFAWTTVSKWVMDTFVKILCIHPCTV